MRIVLLGKNGQVGWELQRSLAPLGEVTALGSDSPAGCGDLRQPDKVVATLRALRPAVVVNAAAHTAVDLAESEPHQAALLNTEAPRMLAETCAELGALFVHYSTDYVFDGSGSTPWQETDPTAPLNVYGRTKRAGEEAILASGASALIFRTSWVYAARGKNFARTILRAAAEREELRVIDDQIGVPTGAELLADASTQALVRTLAQPHLGGLYHLVPAGETSWHAYAEFLCATAREMGQTLSVQRILPVPSTAYATAAERPRNSRLDTAKFRASFGLHLPTWQDGVRRVLAEWHVVS